MSQSEDVGSVVTTEIVMEELQKNFSDISALLGRTRHQILAAQFECYLKIIRDPPWKDEGDKTASIVLLMYSQFNRRQHIPWILELLNGINTFLFLWMATNCIAVAVLMKFSLYITST